MHYQRNSKKKSLLLYNYAYANSMIKSMLSVQCKNVYKTAV